MKKIKLTVEDKNIQIIAGMADSYFLRLRGLWGRRFDGSFDALAITPCGSVHTMFMAYPIDIVFLDRNFKVLKTVADAEPWKPYFGAKGAWTVLEMPSGRAAELGIENGDTFGIREAG